MAAAPVIAALSRLGKMETRLERPDFVCDREFDAAKLPQGRITAQLVKIGFTGERTLSRRRLKVVVPVGDHAEKCCPVHLQEKRKLWSRRAIRSAGNSVAPSRISSAIHRT
jgi:hypothetical protein